jgi:Mn2+/Fe2+ NRAMP family transporter
MPEIGFESQEESRQRMQATVGRLSALVKLGMERGAFEMRDPLLAAGTVLGMVNMPYILFYSGKLVNPVMRDLMVKEVLSATLTYLKKS